MGTKSPGRNLPNAALMASPYVGEALVQVGAATGSAAVAAGVGIGAAALGARTVMRRRESPGQRARRELRQASRQATATRTTAGRGNRKGRKPPSLGSLGSGSKRKAAHGTRAGHGSTATKKRTAARHGGTARNGRASTGLLTKKPAASGHKASGRTSARVAGHRATGGKGAGRKFTSFGNGRRATSARNRAAARGSGPGRGSGLLSRMLPGGHTRRSSNPFKSGPGRKRRASQSQRRNAAAKAAKRRRGASKRNIMTFGNSKTGKLAAKVLRGSWKPMRASRRARSFTGRLVGGTAGLAIGTIGTLASLLALVPSAFEVVRKLGLVAHREASILRSSVAAWMNPYSAEAEAQKIESANSNNRSNNSTGGNAMSEGTAPHIDALIEQVKNASLIDNFAGLNVEAHAQGIARLLVAVAEYVDANAELIKENLPTLDGGESLVQQADLIGAAASGATECADAFSAIHDDRLQRQREPQVGEENWDTSAVRD